MNTTSRAAFIINPSLITMLAMSSFIGSLGLGVVWLRHEISLAANRNRAVEMSLAGIKRQFDEVKAEIDRASTPEELARRNEELRLGLAAPREPQVVRLAEQPELRLASKRHQELYADTAFSPVVFRNGRLR